MPTSDSYHPYLISHLKDQSYAALYIEAILEEKDPEPELLKVALSNVAEALGEVNMSSEQANLHREKLDKLLSDEGIEGIYNLANWLNNLGLKLTVSVSEETEDSSTNTASQSELTV